MIDSISRVLICVLMVALGFTVAGCAAKIQPPVGGNYAPVTAEQLRRAKFSHRTGREKFDFDWSFEGDTFLIQGNEIPTDLTDVMLEPGITAQRIEGVWHIRDGTIEFTTSIDGSNEKGRTCSLPIYFTGVIRIETPAAQYVF